MTTIHDLFEVTGIAAHTTYSQDAGNLLGIVDNVSSADLNDGEFDEGDQILIGGVSYTIDRIQEPASSGRFTLGDGTNLSFNPGSESNLPVVFLTVSNGNTVRHFIIPNDSYGNMNVAEIRTGELTDVGGSDAGVISTTNNTMAIVCFVAGSLIETPGGPVAVETLRIGDAVLTRDNGPQTLRAILMRAVDLDGAPDRLRPVAFEAGSLGPGRPNLRLCVSPQHRMLVTDRSGTAVLVPAKALLGRAGVRVMRGKSRVVYVHLVFSRHEIICANGALTESFFPGPVAMAAIPQDCRIELREILGGGLPAATGPSTPGAAPFLRFQEAKRLALTFS